MRKFNFLYIIVIFAFLLVLQNLLILRSVHEMSGDARVVNYSGLVRGATQRLVKLELSYRPNDELMKRLEEYLYGLAGHENSYDIVYMEYEPFQESISDLLVIWDELKTAIYGYRTGITSADELLDVSERHFLKADEATHNAEYGSEGKVDNTGMLITAGMIAISIIVIIVIISLSIFRRAERRQMELLHDKNQQLEAAILKANEASRAKSLFLSNMSHDIRTPLNGIIGMTTIASGNLNNPDKMQDCLRKIEHSSRLLQSLVNDVLDMSKIESGKLFLNPSEIFLPELIESLVNIIQQSVKTKHQELKLDVFSVTHEKFRGDQLRLNQIFVNILSNAVKFTPPGGTVGMSIRELTCGREGHARFEFICYDTGIGMSEEFKQRLFESFAREEDSRIDKIEGSGLGLSITKRIVDMMEGNILVESEKNRGTRLTITLEFPILDSTDTAIPDAEVLKGIRILAVDHDKMVCASLEADLSSLGALATVKDNTADALALLKDGSVFDIVMIDGDTPDLNGFAFCQIIRREISETIPLLISSVYDRMTTGRDTTTDDISGFITRPLFISTLSDTIRKTLFKDSSPETGHGPGTGLRLDGVHILMAEDNELNKEIAVEILTSAGILLDCASNGKEAVEIFNQSEPFTYAVILMDMQMPVMRGCEATKVIRGLPREDAATIPIIAMTANAFDDDIREALDAGMNEHVSKPVNFETLKKVISSYLPLTETVSAIPVSVEAAARPDSLLEAIALYGVNTVAGLNRFAGNQKIYEKILFKFPQDESFTTLHSAIASEDFDTARKAAHTVKGIAANLSLDPFTETITQLEQALKLEDYNKALTLFQQAKDLYDALTELIDEYSLSNT